MIQHKSYQILADFCEKIGKLIIKVIWKGKRPRVAKTVLKKKNKIRERTKLCFSRSHAQMWELDHKIDWAPKNWCFHTVVPEKTLESPLDSKEIQPVYRKGNQPWTFIGRTDAEVKAPILWPSDAKSRLIGEDPDAGKDWGQEEKWVTEDEMVG